MNEDILDYIEELGPIDEYRSPEFVEESVKELKKVQQELQTKFQKCSLGREQFLFTLEVVQRILNAGRKRASNCELQFSGLACENIDIYYLISEWIEFARNKVRNQPFMEPDCEAKNIERSYDLSLSC